MAGLKAKKAQAVAIAMSVLARTKKVKSALPALNEASLVSTVGHIVGQQEVQQDAKEKAFATKVNLAPSDGIDLAMQANNQHGYVTQQFSMQKDTSLTSTSPDGDLDPDAKIEGKGECTLFGWILRLAMKIKGYQCHCYNLGTEAKVIAE